VTVERSKIILYLTRMRLLFSTFRSLLLAS